MGGGVGATAALPLDPPLIHAASVSNHANVNLFYFFVDLCRNLGFWEFSKISVVTFCLRNSYGRGSVREDHKYSNIGLSCQFSTLI